jgi:hypothetical protein
MITLRNAEMSKTVVGPPTVATSCGELGTQVAAGRDVVAASAGARADVHTTMTRAAARHAIEPPSVAVRVERSRDMGRHRSLSWTQGDGDRPRLETGSSVISIAGVTSD